MLEFTLYALIMKRLDKTLRKKFPEEMAGKNTASLVKHWMNNNVDINICGNPKMCYAVADKRIRHLIKHPELLIKGMPNQSQSTQCSLSDDDKRKDFENAVANIKAAVGGLKEVTDELVDDFADLGEVSEANGGKIPNVNDMARKVLEDELIELEANDGDEERINKLRDIL